MEEKNVFLKTYRGVRRSYSALARHRFTTLAGTLVFFLMMSLMPLAFWLTLLFGNVYPEGLQIELFDWADALFSLIRENAASATAGASVLFLATTLWSSTGFFYHLRRSGEIIYDYRREKKGWRVRLSAVFFTFAILLFVAAAVGVLFGARVLTENLPPVLFYAVNDTLLLAVFFLIVWILNGYVCPYRAHPADTATGSAFTALAWFVASVAFSVYLRFADPERLYGALSVLIIFLLWLYWLMICFTAGVIYNCYRVEQREHKKF